MQFDLCYTFTNTHFSFPGGRADDVGAQNQSKSVMSDNELTDRSFDTIHRSS
jgi:hypothetical protein